MSEVGIEQRYLHFKQKMLTEAKKLDSSCGLHELQIAYMLFNVIREGFDYVEREVFFDKLMQEFDNK